VAFCVRRDQPPGARRPESYSESFSIRIDFRFVPDGLAGGKTPVGATVAGCPVSPGIYIVTSITLSESAALTASKSMLDNRSPKPPFSFCFSIDAAICGEA
jgi:hypothetical protein